MGNPPISSALARSVAAIAFAVLLSSCGGNADKPLPYDATLAVASMQEHDYSEAARHWTAVLDVTTLTPEQRTRAYVGRALALVKEGELDRAIADSDAAMALKPDVPEVHILRGGLYLEKRKPTDALEEFDAALRLKPGFAEAYASRGEALVQQGKYDDAIADLDTAINAKPYVASFFLNRGRAYQLAGKSDLAIADFNEAVRRDPREPEMYRGRWFVFYLAGDFPAAIADLKQSLALRPNQPYVALDLHMIHLRMKEADDAEFSENLAGLKGSKWPLPIVEYYQDRLTLDQLLAAADSDPDQMERRKCAASFYAAQLLSSRHKTDDARRMLTVAEQTCPADFSEYQLVRIELKGM